MKILVVSQYYWPEHFQITEECEELVVRGHDVTVLTGLPNYPSGKIPDDYRKGKNREQCKAGVKIIRASLIERGSNPLQLALNYHSFALCASRAAAKLDDDFDVIYVPEISPVTMIEPAAKYKRIHGTPLLVYCCDLWPESLKTILGNRFGFIVKLYQGISKRLYRSADLIAVQSPAFFEYMETTHGVSKDSMTYLPQFADDTYLDKKFNAEHDGINFLVMGNMGKAQDIPVVLRAASMVPSNFNFTIHFVGEGSFYDQAKKLADELGLENRVIFHGRRPYEEMEAFYSIADACILTLNGDSWIGATIPSRLQGYMAAGKPIIAAVNGGSSVVIGESECGKAVKAGDGEGLAVLIQEFISSPESFSGSGENGKRYFATHFTKARHMDKLEKMLLALAERK